MTGEFTAWCSHYYQLTMLWAAHHEHFKNLLNNASPYNGQNSLSDLDAIISHNRKVHAAKAKVDKTFKELTAAGQTIMKMMQYFEIPPRTFLTGQIPGELEYEIWANENNQVFIGKIRDLQPGPDTPNVIEIKCWNGNKRK